MTGVLTRDGEYYLPKDIRTQAYPRERNRRDYYIRISERHLVNYVVIDDYDGGQVA